MAKSSIFSFFICLLKFSTMIGQAHQMINYQGVALNAAGLALSNQTISIRAAIRNFSLGGADLYSETRSLTTERVGLFDFQNGGPGSSTNSGTWSTVY